MNKLIIQGIIVILLWVGAWGILEMFVDNIAGDNRSVRFATYFIMILFALLLIWAVEISIE